MVHLALILLTAVLALGIVENAAAAECYDVSKDEPQVLTGTLECVVFPGPPNYKDVQGGDAPEPDFVLRLASPICIKGDDFANPANPFSAVQVLGSEDVAGQLRGLVHRTVTLKLKGPLAAESGHHHEPLVAWVTSVQFADSRHVDVVEGSDADTVRAFYEALGRGRGNVANLLVAPEQRRIPAFSASAMSSFYGSLNEPIRLLEINRSGRNAFLIHYRYAASRVCDGRAIVTTSSRDETTYIDSIKALDGC
jgi:hypothetical protein